jgi:ABC-type sugar transport system permease subunit
MTTVTRRRTKLLRSQHIFAGTSLTPIMVYMMFFTLLPMVWAVLITLVRYSPTRQGGLLGLGGGNPFLALRNYADLLTGSPNGQLFRISVKYTLIFALLVLPLNLVVLY